jgi:Ca2+-binding RTX toxin-like protein
MQNTVSLRDEISSRNKSSLAEFLNSKIGTAISNGDPLGNVLHNIDVDDVEKAAEKIARNIGKSLLESNSLQSFVEGIIPELNKDWILDWAKEEGKEISGKLSSFLLSKILSSVDLKTPEGELVKLISSKALDEATNRINNWIDNDFSFDVDLFDGISGASLISGLTNLISKDLGKNLAGSIVNIDSVQDQIGVFLGTLVAQQFLPPGVAQFVGTIVGEFVFDQVLNEWLGIKISFGFSKDRPIVFSYMTFNEDTNSFVQGNQWIKKAQGDLVQAIFTARDTYLSAMNDVVEAVGGRVNVAAFGDPGLAADIGFSHHDGRSFTVNLNGVDVKNTDLSYLTRLAIQNDLRKVSFSDGDMMLARAFENWKNETVGLDDHLVSLQSLFNIAKDYRKYLENVDTINEIIASNSYSAFASGWAATLLRAKALGLEQAFTITGKDAAETFHTSEGHDNVSGGGGDDRILTYSGNDTLTGGDGSDLLVGSFGNDVYFVDAADTIREDRDEGVDTVHAQMDTKLGANLENLVLLAGALNGDGNELNNQITGNEAANTLNGGKGNDWLIGNDGNDILNGGANDDRLTGGQGADQLYGADGNDTASYISSRSGVTANIAKSAGNKGDAAGDIYSSIENLQGSNFADKLVGDAFANILQGEKGDDILTGGKGKDSLLGGQGNDTFVFAFKDTASSRGGADVILDFTKGDRIDLSLLDANVKKAGVQDFEFIGSRAFTKDEGELHFVKTRSDTWIEGDTNGDGKADFVIRLDDVINLSESSFIL